MSKGTKITGVRIPAELREEMKLTIARANVFKVDEPWNQTDFILAAIREKIAKMERSRKGRKRTSSPRRSTS